MSGIIFAIKQGAHLHQRVDPSVYSGESSAKPPRFFSLSQGAPGMKINPLFKDVPFILNKISRLKALKKATAAGIAHIEASEPDYPLLFAMREQLNKYVKLLQEVEGL